MLVSVLPPMLLTYHYLAYTATTTSVNWFALTNIAATGMQSSSRLNEYYCRFQIFFPYFQSLTIPFPAIIHLHNKEYEKTELAVINIITFI